MNDNTGTTTFETERARLRECIAVGDHLTRTLTVAGRAMAVLLGDEYAPLEINRNDPDGPTGAEQAGFWWADRLEQSARRALELHRTGDGPAPADFARACIDFADALRVAAAGRWPDGVEEIEAAMRKALGDVAIEAKVVARGALRDHDVYMEDLSATGPAGARLAGRIAHEARHQLTVLRRIAGANL